MKNYTLTIGLGVISLVALGWIVGALMQRNATLKRQIRVADAGYETAYDILYPPKKGRSYF
jgi:hypothetical protein